MTDVINVRVATKNDDHIGPHVVFEVEYLWNNSLSLFIFEISKLEYS